MSVTELTSRPQRNSGGASPSSGAMLNRSTAAVADTDRQVGDLVRLGIIDQVDLAAGKAIVRIGDLRTPPMDWVMTVGNTTIWIPPTVGQQVIVICPEGDVEQGFVVNGLPSSAFAPLFRGLTNAILFADGTEISHDPEASHLQVSTPGSMALAAPGGLAIKGDVTLTGDLQISGDTGVGKTLTATTDVVGGGKSLKGHRHLGVTAGSAVSGAPQ